MFVLTVQYQLRPIVLHLFLLRNNNNKVIISRNNAKQMIQLPQLQRATAPIMPTVLHYPIYGNDYHHNIDIFHHIKYLEYLQIFSLNYLSLHSYLLCLDNLGFWHYTRSNCSRALLQYGRNWIAE